MANRWEGTTLRVHGVGSGLCFLFGLRDGAGGYEGKKKFAYLKWASHFWFFIESFIFL